MCEISKVKSIAETHTLMIYELPTDGVITLDGEITLDGVITLDPASLIEDTSNQI